MMGMEGGGGVDAREEGAEGSRSEAPSGFGRSLPPLEASAVGTDGDNCNVRIGF